MLFDMVVTSLGLCSRTSQAIFLLVILVLIFISYPRHYNKESPVVAPELSNEAPSEVVTSFLPTVIQTNRPTPIPATAQGPATRPPNQRILEFVFYGRRSRIEILNCYLERNLVSQGGWLDEIHFVRNTKDVDDLAFLERVVVANPHYKILDLPDEDDQHLRYVLSWKTTERDAVYVKIDDDVVWIADDTIPRIVTRKLAYPDYLLVSSNNINNPLMSKVHFDSGAYRPYLPSALITPLRNVPAVRSRA